MLTARGPARPAAWASTPLPWSLSSAQGSFLGLGSLHSFPTYLLGVVSRPSHGSEALMASISSAVLVSVSANSGVSVHSGGSGKTHQQSTIVIIITGEGHSSSSSPLMVPLTMLPRASGSRVSEGTALAGLQGSHDSSLQGGGCLNLRPTSLGAQGRHEDKLL